MTTDKQKRANQANAKKSAGPKTHAGRAASATNARTHGLTAPPPWEDITRTYRIILNDAGATPDPGSSDDVLRAALTLAEAEAQLARCISAERAHLFRMYERAGDGKFLTLRGIAGKVKDNRVDIDVLKFMLERETDPERKEGIKLLIRLDPDRSAELHRRIKTLRRYCREAEARRRKALARWRAVSQSETRASLVA